MKRTDIPLFVFAFANSGYNSEIKINIPKQKEIIHDSLGFLLGKKCCEILFLEDVSISGLVETFYKKEVNSRMEFFQFSGHGSYNSLSFLRKDEWRNQSVTGGSFGKFLGDFSKKSNLKFCYLNFCESLTVAKVANEYGVKALLGMREIVNEDDALELNKRFLRAIGQSHSVQRAYDITIAQYNLEDQHIDSTWSLLGKTEYLENLDWDCSGENIKEKENLESEPRYSLNARRDISGNIIVGNNNGKLDINNW